MAEGEVIVRAVLDDLLQTVGGDRAFLAELIASYFEDTPHQLASMHRALEAGDAEEVRRAAHTLKANSANFGAMTLSAMCREVEALGKRGELTGAAGYIDQIEIEYARVRRALQAAFPPI